jgi:hypothetical protein
MTVFYLLVLLTGFRQIPIAYYPTSMSCYNASMMLSAEYPGRVYACNVKVQ